jgi:hypothetical protein
VVAEPPPAPSIDEPPDAPLVVDPVPVEVSPVPVLLPEIGCTPPVLSEVLEQPATATDTKAS